ncbi:MAG: hypothetical protein ACK5PZ_08075 [Pirellula sp.]
MTEAKTFPRHYKRYDPKTRVTIIAQERLVRNAAKGFPSLATVIGGSQNTQFWQ